jgi:nucleoid-associated protein YgaU
MFGDELHPANPQGTDQEGDQMQTANLQLSVRLSLLLAVVCVVFLLIGGSAGADIPAQPPKEYVVETGDTLWGIASGIVGPDQDVRRVVADINRLSGIQGASIFPGQVLLLPVD